MTKAQTPQIEQASLSSPQDAASSTELVVSPPSTRGLRTRRKPAELAEWSRQKAAEALARSHNKLAQTMLQEVLPLWSDEHRGVPNPMIRSGLFGTKASNKRAYTKNETVTALSNFSILYTGEELLQDDLSVWMSLMNMARRQCIGDVIFFTGYELIKDLGWRMHSESYSRAKESIARLKANELKIQVKSGQAGYAGSLIREYSWKAADPDGGKDKWMVRFEPAIAELFREDMVTYLEWEQRKKIGTRNTTALWLHAYISSHTEPLPITIAKIHELSKSGEQHLKSFKVRVRAALEVLVKIGALISYHIVGDIVHVKKAPLRLATLKDAATKRLT